MTAKPPSATTASTWKAPATVAPTMPKTSAVIRSAAPPGARATNLRLAYQSPAGQTSLSVAAHVRRRVSARGGAEFDAENGVSGRRGARPGVQLPHILRQRVATATLTKRLAAVRLGLGQRVRIWE